MLSCVSHEVPANESELAYTLVRASTEYTYFKMPSYAGGELCLHRGCDAGEKPKEAWRHNITFTILFGRQEGQLCTLHCLL